MPGWLTDAITIGREVAGLGMDVYRTVRERHRHEGRTAPVRIPEIQAEIEERARRRRGLIDDLYPEA